ncbi:MAG: 2,3-bisphosphoglycerate-independent phosphoglycerate mutase [Smithella sp. PtaU1.Bin162]|nr:MAG: 2,3-bisphosphoglycerate-independent phosphoglycerate mutase [Smithella sp. PtaU1.Bin162]
MNPNLNFPMSEAVRKAYNEGQEDETLLPLILANSQDKAAGRICKGDSVIFYNIRGEREIELTRSLTENDFTEFPVNPDLGLHFATMIEYQKNLTVQVAFPPEGILEDTLSDILSRHGKKQVKITEAEKAVHVGFFLNGKKQDLLPGEERIIVPTRKDVALFDEAPEMSIEEISAAAIDKINDDTCNFIVVNFPNVDVVGHIENEAAVLRAVQAVDKQTSIVIDRAVKREMTVIVTADHGTVEKWLYPDGAVDTGHTDSEVPFILLHPDRRLTLRQKGELTDVAPTVLSIFGLPTSSLMTGSSLIEQELTGKNIAKRLLLIILDGWGLNDSKEGNLIDRAATPVMDKLMSNYPISRLAASGEAVGLPAGTVGNSEAGHLHIGAGRKIYSDRLKIDRAIEDKSFYRNKAFLDVMKKAKKKDKALHLMGIVSFFSSHGSINHLFSLMEMAAKEGIKNIFIHAMLGRRGEMPESGARYIRKIEEKSLSLNAGKVVSVIGRYWSMDREDNWDRIEKTYRMLVYGEGTKIQNR